MRETVEDYHLRDDHSRQTTDSSGFKPEVCCVQLPHKVAKVRRHQIGQAVSI